jgi:hypothetical protein
MRIYEEIIRGMTENSLPSAYWADTVGFTELESSKHVMQNNGQSVWEHTMLVIDILADKNPITLLSGLLHDLGKCCVKPVDETYSSKFPGHEIESAHMAQDILSRWDTPEFLIDRVVRLIAMHMYDISDASRDKTIRKFVASVGFDNVDNWFTLRIADSRSYAEQQKYYNRFIDPFRIAVNKYLDKQPNTSEPEIEISDVTGGMQIKGGDVK